MIYEPPLTILELQRKQDEERIKSNTEMSKRMAEAMAVDEHAKGLRKHLIAEATEELLQYIVDTPGLPQPLCDKALNLLNALNK